MIIYRTHFLATVDDSDTLCWGEVEKLVLKNKADVLLELSIAVQSDPGKNSWDSHYEYHPTKAAAEKYMKQYSAEAESYWHGVSEY